MEVFFFKSKASFLDINIQLYNTHFYIYPINQYR